MPRMRQRTYPHLGAVICPNRANESACAATYVQNEGGTPFDRSNATARQNLRTKTSRQGDFGDRCSKNRPNFTGHAFAIAVRRCEGTARSGVPTHFLGTEPGALLSPHSTQAAASQTTPPLALYGRPANRYQVSGFRGGLGIRVQV